MDALSDVLSLLKPRSYTCAGFDMGAGHSIRIPAHEGIFCYAVVSGEMWLSVAGEPDEVLLKAGDCVILPTGRSFDVSTGLGVNPVKMETVLQGRQVGSINIYKGGGKCIFIGCHFLLDGNADILLNVLPPIGHINSDKDRATLHWALDHMRSELHEPKPGGALIVEHIAQLLLVQALRLHLEEGGVGWLYALSDKQMSMAITAMHGDPAHRWTLDSLADRTGMSRTRFAVRFKAAVGVAPLDYLRRWRMLLAANRLTTTTDSVSTIALSLGYESESAFSAAFTRVMGMSPRRYAQSRLAA